MNSVFIDIANNKNISSVLLISTDVEYLNKIKKVLGDKYDVVFFNNDRFYLLKAEINCFDL